jgi:PPP family 3-phenylpropionic acid transporter
LSARSFWLLISLNLIALTAQSALMPLSDTITLAAARSEGLDYGRIRLWGSVSFIVASIASGAALASSSGERVLPLVLGASTLVLLACLHIPSTRPVEGRARTTGIGIVAGDPRFWIFILAASALQVSHQVYYGLGTPTGARSVSRTRRSAGFGRKEFSPKSCSSGRAGGYSPGSGRSD